MPTESIIEDWDEEAVRLEPPPCRGPKLAPWREAERYFKRYRDTQKVIPLRMKLKDNEVG